ncbi:hypothetical protein [Idiomarina piscisalsi]|uniref:hypothetical protein n=1 Tax=Idiomarina piscisalsi TaxID=1096243 RepID=UPI0026EAC9DB|nr:hypothetical protein [Idiomarina piscisalsi]
MVSIIALAFGVLPLMILVGMMQLIRPTGNWRWIYGVACILLAAFSLWVLDHILPTILSYLSQQGEISKKEYASFGLELSLWLYLCPAVTAAIGANFISSYLLREEAHNR